MAARIVRARANTPAICTAGDGVRYQQQVRKATKLNPIRATVTAGAYFYRVRWMVVAYGDETQKNCGASSKHPAERGDAIARFSRCNQAAAICIR
jgi:hypothetical protein